MLDFSYWFLSSAWPWIIAVVHLAITLGASAHVVLTKRDPRAAIGWIGIVWLAPIVGTLIYLVFGINRIQRKARALRRGVGQRDSSPGKRSVPADIIHLVLAEESQHLAPLTGFVNRLTHERLVDGNHITPLCGGSATYAAMLAAIDGAQRSVALQTYIFDNDSLGQRFAQALAHAKERGCEVRVLIDSVGARYTWPSITHALHQYGIRAATFNPTLIPGKLHYTNLRNHRKIAVIDGQLGFTGGMNLRAGHLCEPGTKHAIEDMHFQIEGPVVAHLRDTFAEDWEYSTGEVLSGPAWHPPLRPCGQSLCRGIADGPDIEHDKIRLTIMGAIGCARQSVEIVTPYFLPEQPMINALNVAAMRGVAVHIILPEQGNLVLVQWACMAQLWQILQRGCRVWLSPRPFDHTKLMVVDGAWSLIGSANWDPRSLRLNFEFNVECYDRDLAGQLAAIIHGKRARSREISLADVDGRPLWMRLRDGVCRLALPYL